VKPGAAQFSSTGFWAACAAHSPTAEGAAFAGGARGIEPLTLATVLRGREGSNPLLLPDLLNGVL